MPVSGNPYSTLRRAFQKTVSERQQVTRAMAKVIKDVIGEQFAAGIDPYGRQQPELKGGGEAFVSEKLGRAIKLTPRPDGVEGVGELKASKGRDSRRQWLDAHQKGHVFPPRQVSGGRQAFNAKGERVKLGQLARQAKNATRRVTVGQREAYWQERKRTSRFRGHLVHVRSHRIGERVLRVRLIYPDQGVGARWGGRIKGAISEALSKQLSRNVERG